jgi:hypothetical protein
MIPHTGWSSISSLMHCVELFVLAVAALWLASAQGSPENAVAPRHTAPTVATRIRCLDFMEPPGFVRALAPPH